MRMCHEWETAEAAAWRQLARLGSVHIVQLPHTTEYHIKPPVHENCSCRLQWACELENLVSKLQLACVLYSASSRLHSCHLLYFGKIAVAIDCHFLKSNPQTCWIRVSVNFNDSINSEHRADFVHSDFFWQSRPPNKPIKKGILAYP